MKQEIQEHTCIYLFLFVFFIFVPTLFLITKTFNLKKKKILDIAIFRIAKQFDNPSDTLAKNC